MGAVRSVSALLLAAAVGAGVAIGVNRLDDGGDRGTTTVVLPVSETSGGGPSTAPPLLGNGFDPAAIYTARSPGVVTIYASVAGSAAQGAGFVVDAKGTILTNAHVITNVATSSEVVGADRVYVEYADGDRAPARVVGWDLFSDVGVIDVDPTDHAVSPVPLGRSAAVRVGQPVAAIGSPFGNQNSLAVGVVSATGRSIASLTSGYDVADAIQIDAPINRGNSGGPLFDAAGRVIGINAQINTNSGVAEGVGFAIPIDTVKRALAQIAATGRAAYAYIGITTQDLLPGLARELELPVSDGALVARVETGTPAEAAGLQGGTGLRTYNGLEISTGGDIVLAIAGNRVRSAEDVSRIVVGKLSPGQKVPFLVLRDGKRITVSVTLGERPARPAG